jgi:predicted aldo/keto reductase-like oxidoreductase
MGPIETSGSSETGLPTRILGRTGARVSILGLGGWHIGAIKDEAEAIRIMHSAIDEGLTFFDNSWCYHDGHAEEVMGKALATGDRRERVFLMTKNCERDYAGSMKCLEDSLRRLKTDHLDLWQFHECIYDNDPDWIFDRGGIDAALEAQRQGKVRFIGFTGHKDPRLHTKMLSKPHEWDATQMPVNVMDTVYRSYQQEVLPECLKREIGVIGMKALGGGYPQGTFLKSAGLAVEECYRFALSQPVSVQVCGINSMEHLLQDIQIGRSWKPMPEDEVKTLVARVREEAGDGRHELFKSTTLFDGPHHVKQHGFAASTT